MIVMNILIVACLVKSVAHFCVCFFQMAVTERNSAETT